MKRSGRRLNTSLAAIVLGSGVLLTAGAAQAQFYVRGYMQPFFEPVYPPPVMSGPLRSAEIAGIVSGEGFRVLARPRRNGDVFLVDAQDRRGRVLRIIVDAYDGEILQTHVTAVPRPPGAVPGQNAALEPRIIEEWEAPPRTPPRPQVTPVPRGEQRATRPVERTPPKAAPRPPTAAIETKPLPAPDPAQTSPAPAATGAPRPAPLPSEASRVTPPGSERPPAPAAAPPQAALPEAAKAAPGSVRPVEQPLPTPAPVRAAPIPLVKPDEQKDEASRPSRSRQDEARTEEIGSGTKMQPRVVGVPIAPLDDIKPAAPAPATPRVPVAPLD